MSKDKNELITINFTLRKFSDESVQMKAIDGTGNYALDASEANKLKIFLSTPYQEEEVYVRIGDRVMYINPDTNKEEPFIVSCLNDDVFLVSLIDGTSHSLAEWRVLPREEEK